MSNDLSRQVASLAAAAALCTLGACATTGMGDGECRLQGGGVVHARF